MKMRRGTGIWLAVAIFTCGIVSAQTTQNQQTDLDMVQERSRRTVSGTGRADLEQRLKSLETKVATLQKEGGTNSAIHSLPGRNSDGKQTPTAEGRVSERLRHKDRVAATRIAPETVSSLKSRVTELHKELASARDSKSREELGKKISELEAEVSHYFPVEGDPDRPVVVGR